MFLSEGYAWGQTSGEPDKELIIKQIAKANEGYKSIISPFEQIKNMRGLKKEIISSGVLYFKRATGELNMQYSKPADNKLIITGDKLLMIKGKAKNSYNTKSNAAMKTLKMSLIYSIGGDVEKVALVNKAEINMLPEGEYYTFELLIGEQVKGGWARLQLSYGKKDFSLCNMKMIEKNGNSVTYKTPVKEFNVALPEDIFN